MTATTLEIIAFDPKTIKSYLDANLVFGMDFSLIPKGTSNSVLIIIFARRTGSV